MTDIVEIKVSTPSVTINSTGLQGPPGVEGTIYTSYANLAAASIDSSKTYVYASTGAGVIRWKRDTAGTALTTADGAKWSPDGEVWAEHFAENVSPGETDMAPAIKAALAYAGSCRLAATTYAVGQTIAADSVELIGEGAHGKRTLIVGLSASLAVSDPILKLGRSSIVKGFALKYDTLTGSEGSLERVGFDSRGSTYMLQRGATVDNILIYNVGTAIVDNGFSVTYGTIEIGSHSYKGIDNIAGGTGSIWLNTYVNGGNSYTPYRGVDVASREAGGFWGQLNLEHQTYSDAAVNIDGAVGVNIGTLHLEGVDLSVADKAYVRLSRSSINIGTLAFLNTRMSNDGVKLVELGEASYAESGSGAYSRQNRLRIGVLHTQGLAAPSTTTYPDYPLTRRGLDKISGFEFFSRPASYTDADYIVDVGIHEWQSYQTQFAADQQYYINAWRQCSNLNGNITLAKLGALGEEVAPRENWVKNGAFDTWVAASSSSSSITPVETATGFYIRSTTGTISANQVADDIGRDNDYFVRLSNVGTPGTYQWFYQNISDVRRLSGKRVVLSFEARASAAGQRLNQISCSLANAGGTPSSQYVQAAYGPSPLLSMGTKWKPYEFSFVLPAVMALGSSPYFQLLFEINGSSASRESQIDIRNVKLEIGRRPSSFSRRTRT